MKMLAVRYYGSISATAEALDTSRDTVRAWIDDPPRRIRKDLLRRMELLTLLCKDAERYMANANQAGRWTLAPHPGFKGRSPAEALRVGGRATLRRLQKEMVDYVPARQDPELEVDESRLLEEIRGELDGWAEVELDSSEEDLGPDEEDLADVSWLKATRPAISAARIVLPNGTRGGWDIRKKGAARASAHLATRGEAEERARKMIAREGGGELSVQDEAGRQVGGESVDERRANRRRRRRTSKA